MLEAKVAASDENQELASLLRLNGIEFDDSPLQQSPSQASETPQDHFDRFLEKVAGSKTEKEVLKGFADFRVDSSDRDPTRKHQRSFSRRSSDVHG